LNKKIIGICFGHQIIARTFGGVVEKGQNGWEVPTFISGWIHRNQAK
jgi:GMP synthase-like glutamine amidotransferase